MECPTSTVRTDESTVGEGVLLATSRSMTLFWSLQYFSISSRLFCHVLFVACIPFFEPGHAVMEVPSRFESRVYYRGDSDLG